MNSCTGFRERHFFRRWFGRSVCQSHLSSGLEKVLWKYGGNTVHTVWNLRLSFWHFLTSAVPSPAPTSKRTNPHERFREHVSDEAEDSLLERWTKLGEAVLA